MANFRKDVPSLDALRNVAPGTASRLQVSLTRHDGVVINVLHIVAIVEHRHELFERWQVVFADLSTGLRDKRDFLSFQIDIRKRFL